MSGFERLEVVKSLAGLKFRNQLNLHYFFLSVLRAYTVWGDPV